MTTDASSAPVETIFEARVPAPTSPLITGAQAASIFANALVVEDDEGYAFADTQLADLKGKADRLDEERRAIVDPINAGVKRINDLFRPARQFYEHAETIIKGKMLTYHQAQAQKRREAEEEASRRAAEEQQQRETEALKRSEEAARRGDVEASQRALEDAVAPPPMPVVAAPQAPRAAASRVSMVWAGETKDLLACVKAAAAGNKNALACLTWNTPEITQRVKALKADFDVPGIVAREVPQMATRASR